jgi:ABC-type branched-subunit amino acid transport system ATPase component
MRSSPGAPGSRDPARPGPPPGWGSDLAGPVLKVADLRKAQGAISRSTACRSRSRAKADALIDQFRIRRVAHQNAGELSCGQQKLVDIAMAIMSEPGLVLLDEPCAGVNPSLVGGISSLLKALNAGRRGSFIVIEHDMDFVVDLCHRVMVMVEGTVMAIGTPAGIRANKQVLDACLGN